MKIEFDDLRASYSAVFSGEHGRVVLGDLANMCFHGASPYCADSMRETDRRIAKQEVFLHILAMLGEDPSGRVQMEVINGGE